jgi:glycosyltransferase involved in cell wall biosynthesis
MVRLSIITIAYNDLAGLRKTFASVFEQTEQSFEYIVVDGGSTDGSSDFIKENASRIHKWVSEKDKGIYDAQNKGWKVATGEYCLFLNSGDCLEDKHVIQNIYKKTWNTELLFGNIHFVDDSSGMRLGVMPHTVGAIHLYKDTIWHPASIIKRSVLQQFDGFDLQYRIVADYAFFCRYVLDYKGQYTHLETTIARFDMSGISSNPKHRSALEEERRKVQNTYFPHWKLLLFRLYTKIR